AKPDDAEAKTLQRDATGLGIIQHAEKMGQQGDFIGGGQELKRALLFLPDNSEAKQLIADFKQHEPEQIERLRVERLARPKKVFDFIMSTMIATALFESHELITGKPAAETHAAIELQLTSVEPIFKMIRSTLTNEI